MTESAAVSGGVTGDLLPNSCHLRPHGDPYGGQARRPCVAPHQVVPRDTVGDDRGRRSDGMTVFDVAAYILEQ